MIVAKLLLAALPMRRALKEYGSYGLVNNAAFIALLLLGLNGCLTEPSSKSAEETVSDNVLTGSVGDGPVAGAAMRILRNDGEELARFVSDSMAVYNVTARAKGSHYPLTIESQGGNDLVTNLAPDFTLFSAVLESTDATVANVNPFSTFAVMIARALPGGVTKENVAAGQTIAVTSLNSGLSSLIVPGPVNTRIDSSNISEIVKASEALAETVRRTRDLLNAYGYTATGDEVVRNLAADLVDGRIDGVGGYQSDARTAAIAKVVLAQLLLETAGNELHVNGVDATDAMKSAIDQVSTSPLQATIDDQTITPQMLTSVKIGLTAALAISQAPKLIALDQAAGGLQSGMEYMLVRALLPVDYRAILDNVLSLVAGGDASVIAAVNSINEPGNGGPAPNRAPSIQGAPRTTAQVGSPYVFAASASDPDGDPLTFSIIGQPVWTTFDASRGELTGTPSSDQIATYSNISISVTDGVYSASLAPFSITVSAAIAPNSPPVISGNPATSINVNNAYSFTPTASDADNNTLTFSVTGLPLWGTFDDVTGHISGTPGDSDVGVYPGIRISVSDGMAEASLAPFSISVNAISLGSVTLNWTAPTENTDGSTLLDLEKYRIYWGTESGNYTNSVTINAGTTTYIVENLAAGTYEFVATAINFAGIESTYSNPIVKTVF